MTTETESYTARCCRCHGTVPITKAVVERVIHGRSFVMKGQCVICGGQTRRWVTKEIARRFGVIE